MRKRRKEDESRKSSYMPRKKRMLYILIHLCSYTYTERAKTLLSTLCLSYCNKWFVQFCYDIHNGIICAFKYYMICRFVLGMYVLGRSFYFYFVPSQCWSERTLVGSAGHSWARRKAMAMVLAQAGLIPRYLREYIAKKKLTRNEYFFLKQHHLCLFDVDILPFWWIWFGSTYVCIYCNRFFSWAGQKGWKIMGD